MIRTGLFYELETGPKSGSEFDVWHNALKQIEFAEQMGFAAAFMVEHHFNPGYSHSPCPEVFMAAASQRTTVMRLGTGVRLLPLHDPIRTAERFAALDILSKGRFEGGIGRGITRLEYSTFRKPLPYGVTAETNRQIFMEHLEVMRKCWTEDGFTYHGKHYQIDEPLTVVPKPVQKPHPRLWAPATSPGSLEAYLGAGLHYFAGTLTQGLNERTFARTAEARKIWEQAGHAKREPLQIGCLVPVHCAETREKAKDEMREYEELYFHLLQKYFAPQDPEDRKRREAGLAPGRQAFWQLQGTFDEAYHNRMVICGDPDDCIRELKDYEKAGITLILGVFQLGGMPHELVMNSIRLFGKAVIPNLS